MPLKPKRLNRGRRGGVPGYIALAGVLIAALVLGACAHSPRRAPHHTPAHLSHTKPAADAYPNLTTYTGIQGLLFMRLVYTGAHWPSMPGGHRRFLHFVPLTHGRVKNWTWTVLADKSLVPLYRLYRQRSPLRWTVLMRRLRHAIGAVFPAPLPPIHFILHMAPAGGGYAMQCWSFTRRVLRLCYAFPFHRRLGQDDYYWENDMQGVAGFLSHETVNAVLMNNQWGTPYQRTISKDLNSTPGTVEAIASLFSMYFPQRFGALSSDYQGVILPPFLYGLSHAKLTHMSTPLHNFTIGGEIAGLALERAFGGYRAICSNDRQALRTYRALMARLVRNLPRLRALEPEAVRRMSQPFTGLHVQILTAHGVKSVPVDLLNGGPLKPGQSGLGGLVIEDFFNHKDKAHPSKSSRLYREFCGVPT